MPRRTDTRWCCTTAALSLLGPQIATGHNQECRRSTRIAALFPPNSPASRAPCHAVVATKPAGGEGGSAAVPCGQLLWCVIPHRRGSPFQNVSRPRTKSPGRSAVARYDCPAGGVARVSRAVTSALLSLAASFGRSKANIHTSETQTPIRMPSCPWAE